MGRAKTRPHSQRTVIAARLHKQGASSLFCDAETRAAPNGAAQAEFWNSKTMMIVSSLERAEATFEKYAPRYVVSVLDAEEPTPPAFSSILKENRLKLIGDCARPEDCCGGDAKSRCAKILELAERWKQEREPRPPILIHCRRGAARSMAVAYILMCAIEKASSEKAIAARLRAAAPHADPNLLLVAEADALLGRDDRMVEAILDLGPASGCGGGSVVTLPVAA